MAESILITTVAMGSWYPEGAARLGESVKGHAHMRVHFYPAFTAPIDPIYLPYLYKPYALAKACTEADVAILCDASFYSIRSIQPLVDHILRVGYYLCRNGSTIGEWTSDRCLKFFGIAREDAMRMEDCSSYCVGISTRDPAARMMVERWRQFSIEETIAGPHTSTYQSHRRSRNRGFVSHDKRVRGHRHDQSVLSIVAHQLGMMEWVNRPKFTAYKGCETEETVLVCEGMVSH